MLPQEAEVSKALTIKIENELYEEIVKRAGGPRKISKLLVPIIKAGLADGKAYQGKDMTDLRQEVSKINERLRNLEMRQK
jgi:hypothetical protein